MIRVSRRRPLMGLVVLACVAGLTACGGGEYKPEQHGAATTSPPPGAIDASICQVITKATTAYNAKDYATWRSDMVQIASAADSAQYTPIKKYAEEVKRGVKQATTTTTKPKGKHSSKSKASEGGVECRRPVRFARWFCRPPARLCQSAVAGIDLVGARRTRHNKARVRSRLWWTSTGYEGQVPRQGHRRVLTVIK